MIGPDDRALLRQRPPVFFTGGTALRELSRTLVRHGCFSVHLVTTFDSGGSTARLRSAFAMPAVGDLRNRLVALAGTDEKDLVRCMETRLPPEGEAEELRDRLRALADPGHAFWQGLAPMPAKSLQHCLQTFLQAMPQNFDARMASLGNVFLAGRYLQEHRCLNASLALFARLLHVQGQVVPIVEESLHLAARLQDGTLLVGQHRFKELAIPVRQIFLTVYEPGRGSTDPTPCHPRAATQALARLREASLVCYPMGSFFSSVLANLLPEGVGRCIAGLSCPKVFIPNTGRDPELVGLSIADEVQVLLEYLGRDCPHTRPDEFLTHVLVDSRHGRYGSDCRALQRELACLGIEVVDAPVVLADGLHHDTEATADWLIGTGLGHARTCREEPDLPACDTTDRT